MLSFGGNWRAVQQPGGPRARKKQSTKERKGPASPPRAGQGLVALEKRKEPVLPERVQRRRGGRRSVAHHARPCEQGGLGVKTGHGNEQKRERSILNYKGGAD